MNTDSQDSRSLGSNEPASGEDPKGTVWKHLAEPGVWLEGARSPHVPEPTQRARGAGTSNLRFTRPPLWAQAGPRRGRVADVNVSGGEGCTTRERNGAAIPLPGWYVENSTQEGRGLR